MADSEIFDESDGIMKKPCKHCPFRRDVQIFGSVARAEEFALMSINRYTWFHCHKTGDVDEDNGDFVPTAESLECAGLLSMKVHSGTIKCPDGFEASPNVFSDSYEMTEQYTDWLGHDDRWDDEDDD